MVHFLVYGDIIVGIAGVLVWPLFRNGHTLPDFPYSLLLSCGEVLHDAVDDGRVSWQVDVTEQVGTRVPA